MIPDGKLQSALLFLNGQLVFVHEQSDHTDAEARAGYLAHFNAKHMLSVNCAALAPERGASRDAARLRHGARVSGVLHSERELRSVELPSSPSSCCRGT
jgi:hypothetical protein